ncbi:glycogen debranching protein GlgX [Candidatus Methylomirabilis sp.]|uniref:glycogen debranching protein GlgX n=1 Tax=Candidatus Methylomirabilis sp. TaxID=2032687 RepID=UPI002A63F7B8|nr:glycogen debranching protein GlgX [Candidatus Methylomirabilis sp.]
MTVVTVKNRLQVEKGSPHPLGATPDQNGVNFSLFSENATGVEILLFERHDVPEPFQIIQFDPFVNKTFHFWHVYVRGARPGILYAYRVDGSPDRGAGHRFDRTKVLIDPYARGNTNSLWRRADACGPDDNLSTSMRSVAIETSGYDWEGDRPLNRPMEDTIIYELHVRGFTKSPSSGVAHPGTFSGVIEKVPYLKELGVTAVELLPIFDFDETDVLRVVDGTPLNNFWGYSTMGFFAPQSAYCVSPKSGSHLREFRDMVKALHKAGIEVILDVVFNHTDEGNHLGPVFSFKGIDNLVYYFLVPWDRQFYLDYSGCGNTLNCNHPIPQKLIVECLRYWVRETHVDGFRFDEGSILSRGEDGSPLPHPPVVWQIELDEELADTKVIAEAWDAAGLYQIGHFPGDRWAEWNGRYRDDIRRFVKGDPGLIGTVASRLAGSADLYQAVGELPINSINFITCHDGFTLNDLVSYNVKHNEGNGEGNRDGINDNLSWNCGVEGETDDAAIEALRERQIKNFITILLLSRGVPMILSGDEVRRTQKGNNNAYCQDNEIGWVDWTMSQTYYEMFRFWKRMIEFRKTHSTLRQRFFFSGAVNERDVADVSWHGCKLNQPEWSDLGARELGMTLGGFDDEPDIHVMLNMHWEGREFEIPSIPDRRWFKVIDTAASSPHDIADPGDETEFAGHVCSVQGRSIVVLVSG